MTSVSYPQAVALKALGMPQESVLVYEKHGFLRMQPTGVTLRAKRVDGPYLAAPNVIDAILWVLGSDPWWDKCAGVGWHLTIWEDCATISAINHIELRADTPSDLLDAVLAAVKEAS